MNDKLNFIQSKFKHLKQDPERLKAKIEQIETKFEVIDNLEVLVLKTKLERIILGENFKLEKAFMCELEELSNNSGKGKVAAITKALIFENMLDSNQTEIATKYAAKQTLRFAGDLEFQQTFIYKLSKMAERIENGVQFVLDLILKFSAETLSNKVFENIRQHLSFKDDSSSLMIRTYEV